VGRDASIKHQAEWLGMCNFIAGLRSCAVLRLSLVEPGWANWVRQVPVCMTLAPRAFLLINSGAVVQTSGKKEKQLKTVFK